MPRATKHPLPGKLALARRLKLQHLAVLEQVVASGSTVAAARALHISQPAVSKTIHELEDHFGETIFLRGKRGAQLTTFGQLLARHARTMLAELHLLADDVQAWQSGAAGQVVVGTLISASATLLPRAIVRLRRVAPDVRVRVEVGPNPTLFAALARSEVDLVVGLVPVGDAAAGFTSIALREESLSVVVGRRHPLATRTSIGRDDLARCQWVVPTSGSAAWAAVQRFFDSHDLPVPAQRVESVSILTSLGLLLEAPMAALMPHSAAEQFARAGLLSLLPLATTTPFGAVGCSLRAGHEPTAATLNLIDALKAVAGQSA
jgi:DNA-binding transcriptional LysR family regulator